MDFLHSEGKDYSCHCVPENEPTCKLYLPDISFEKDKLTS